MDETDDAELIDMTGARFKLLARMGPAEGDTVLFRTAMAAGSAVPLHSHIDPEGFYLLSGGIEVYLDDAVPGWRTVATGETLIVADGVKHAIRNTGDEAADMVLFTNNRLADYFRQAGRPGKAGGDVEPPTPADVERMVKVALAFGYWIASPEESAAVLGGAQDAE